MFLRSNLVFLLLIVMMMNALAQTRKKPASVAKKLSAENRHLEKSLDSIFSSFNLSTPGIAVVILQDKKLLAKKCYGMASLEFGIPFSQNTLVRIPYSEGRIFISIAAALMEMEGKLQLNDKVRTYYPQLPDWSEPVTIQDLLNHSSGFADEWATLALTQASMANRLDRSQFLQFLYNQKEPSVEPGKGYMYSNSDFGLLRLILEKASGEDLAAYMKRKIFDPLRMSTTRLHDDKEAVIPNHAFTYNIGVKNSYKLWLQDKTSPGGNYYVLTSASDLEHWAAAQADPASFVSISINRLKQKARPIPVLPGVNYVFGQKLRKIGIYETLVYMGVSELPFVAYVPEKKLTVILQCNLFMPRWNLMNQVLSAALQLPTSPIAKKDFPTQPIRITPEELKPLAGTYKWMAPLTFQSYLPRQRFTKFLAEDSVFRIIYGIGDTLALVPVAKNTFRDPEYPDVIVFSQLHPDSTIQATFYSSGGDTIFLKKMNGVRPQLERKQLKNLVGTYYSRHLDFFWTLALNENNQLVVKRPTIADKIMEPSADGEFLLMMDYGPYSSEGWIRFHFKENGDVSHFTVSHPRLMHHRFDKVGIAD